jgi:Reverse transcriptase (RNA-dependent DNA polymerase)
MPPRRGAADIANAEAANGGGDGGAIGVQANVEVINFTVLDGLIFRSKDAGDFPKFYDQVTGMKLDPSEIASRMQLMDRWADAFGLGKVMVSAAYFGPDDRGKLNTLTHEEVAEGGEPNPHWREDYTSLAFVVACLNFIRDSPIAEAVGLPDDVDPSTFTKLSAIRTLRKITAGFKVALMHFEASTIPHVGGKAISNTSYYPELFNECPESDHPFWFLIVLARFRKSASRAPGLTLAKRRERITKVSSQMLGSIDGLGGLPNARKELGDLVRQVIATNPPNLPWIEHEAAVSMINIAIAATDRETDPALLVGTKRIETWALKTLPEDDGDTLLQWRDIDTILGELIASYCPTDADTVSKREKKGTPNFVGGASIPTLHGVTPEQAIEIYTALSPIMQRAGGAGKGKPADAPARSQRPGWMGKDGKCHKFWVCRNCAQEGHDTSQCKAKNPPADAAEKAAAKIEANTLKRQRERLAGNPDKSRPPKAAIVPEDGGSAHSATHDKQTTEKAAPHAAFLAEIRDRLSTANQTTATADNDTAWGAYHCHTVGENNAPKPSMLNNALKPLKGMMRAATRALGQDDESRFENLHGLPHACDLEETTEEDFHGPCFDNANGTKNDPEPLTRWQLLNHAMGTPNAIRGITRFFARTLVMITTILSLYRPLGAATLAAALVYFGSGLVDLDPANGIGKTQRAETLAEQGRGRRTEPGAYGTRSSQTFFLVVITTILLGAVVEWNQQPCTRNHGAYASASGSMSGAHEWLDTGAMKAIFGSRWKAVNIRSIPAISIKGVAGNVSVHEIGDFPFTLSESDGTRHDFVLKDIHINPSSTVDLLSVQEMNDLGIGCVFPKTGDQPYLNFTSVDGRGIEIPIARLGNLFPLPNPENSHSYHSSIVDTQRAIKFTLTDEELWHIRFVHMPIRKMITLSKRCIGMKRPLHEHGFTCPCHVCMDANSIRCNFPPASKGPRTGLWSLDLLDVGEKHASLSGHRYLSIFVIADSRYCIVLPHKLKSDAASVLERAIIIAGKSPTVLQTDGAYEYVQSKEYKAYLESLRIKPQTSCAYEQHQNGKAETLVNAIGRGMRAQLLDSNLSSPFWVLAACNFVDNYNITPHDSLTDNITPWEAEKGTLPNVAAHRPFGCRVTVFLGKDRVQHHKLSPRGEPCIYVGLGHSNGYKGWLCYSPRMNHIYCTRNARFDDCFMPLRTCDQRIRSGRDPTTRTKMILDTYKDMQTASNIADEIEAMCRPFAADNICETDPFDADQDPNPPPHAEADPLIVDDGSPSMPRPSLDGSNSGTTLPEPTVPAAGGAGGEARSPTPPTTAETAASEQKMELLSKRQVIQATDEELLEWLIYHCITIDFPSSMWYKGGTKGAKARAKPLWEGTVIDNTGHSPPQAKVYFAEEKEGKENAFIQVSAGNNSVRKALAATYPTSKTLQDILANHRLRTALNGPPIKTKGMLKAASKAFRYALTMIQEGLGADTASVHFKRAKGMRARGDVPGAAYVAMMATSMVCLTAQEYACKSGFLPPEPRSHKDATSRPDWGSWEMAEAKEMATLFEKGVFQLVDRPKGCSEIPCSFRFKLKVENGDMNNVRYKARLVLRGDMQYDDEYDETYSPTARMWAIRLLTSVAAQESLLIKHFDICAAFVTSDIDKELYVEIPGFPAPEGKTYKLKRALYGAKQAGNLYATDINKWLTEYGFVPTSTDPTLYRLDRNGSYILLSLYVDDGFAATNCEKLYAQFIKDLSSKYELSDVRDCDWHLGMRFTRDAEAGTITIDQRAYAENVLKRFDMADCTPKAAPMASRLRLSKADCPETPNRERVKLYQQIIGSLLFLSGSTRPDLALAVNQCAQFMGNPGEVHLAAAKHILRYMKGTLDYGLTYGRAKDGLQNCLYGYVDADHAACPDDRKSVAGYAIMLNSAAISWSSRKIKVTSLSSFESEWYAASICGCEVEVLRRTLEEIGFAQDAPTVLYEDNAAVLFASDKSKPMSTRSRHIDTRVFRLRDLTSEGVLKLVKIATGEQMADCMTKALPAGAVATARDFLCGAFARASFAGSSFAWW